MTTSKPWSDLVTDARLTELHAVGVATFGGPPDSPALECLDRSLGAAWTAELYVDESGGGGGLVFAACLLWYLARNHCAKDGNKRLAWMAVVEVLSLRGLTVDATDDDVLSFVNGVASGALDRDAAIEFIASRVIAA